MISEEENGKEKMEKRSARLRGNADDATIFCDAAWAVDAVLF
jgi:hypothetical protein